MLRLFRVTVALFLALLSVAFLAVVFTAIVSLFQSLILSRTGGIAAVAGGVSETFFTFVILAALFLALAYLFWRKRKLR